MKNVKRYLFIHINQVFYPLFFVLFFISSVILFIKISGLTSVIKITFGELFLLYLYSMPAVIFFTIPVTFFAAGVIALAKLSYDYELVVLFSLGLKPKVIARRLFPVLAGITALLMLLSLGMIPISKELYKTFIEEKRKNASMNIEVSEFGHKFGDWLVFINGKGEQANQFENVVLFSNKSFGKESFLLADQARLVGDEQDIRLELEKGSATIEEKQEVWQIDYETMQIRDPRWQNQDGFTTVFEYWAKAFFGDAKRAKDFCASILTSLFPLVSLPLILCFGIQNPRYGKNRAYFYVILSCMGYYGLTYLASINFPFLGIFIIPIVWILGSTLLYRYHVGRYY